MSKGHSGYFRWKDVLCVPNKRCLPYDSMDYEVVYKDIIDLYDVMRLFDITSRSEVQRKLNEGAIKVDYKPIYKNRTFGHGMHDIRYGKWIVVFLWICKYRKNNWEYFYDEARWFLRSVWTLTRQK